MADPVLRFAQLTLLGPLVALGCANGHGEYTSELKEEATQKMSKIRAAADYDLATQQFKGGDLKNALSTVDSALAVTDQVPSGHLLRGRILLEQGQPREALGSFDRALELEPDNAEVLYFTGLAYERLDQKEVALARYRRAIGFDSTTPQYVLAAAELLVELDRLAEARQLLEQNVSNSEYEPGFRQSLGHIAMMEGDVGKACNFFTEAVVLGPNDPVLLEDLCRALIAARRYAEAETSLSQLLRSPECAGRMDLKHLRASCLIELDQPVEARAILRDLTRAETNNVEAWVKMIDVALILKDDSMLRDVSNRIIALAPDRHEGYLSLAIYQRKQGDLEKALSSLELAVERSGKDPTPGRLHRIIEQQISMRQG